MDHKLITIADQIFEQLEKDILSGKIPKDTQLTEPKLSSLLGVSRTPIREALRRLEQEHFIEETPKGLLVVGITKEDLRDYYEIRLALEGRAAELAAAHITDESLNDLSEAISMQAFYLDRQKKENTDCSEKIKDLDSRFHELLYRSTGSAAYQEVLLPIHKKITKYRKSSVCNTSRAEESIREHTEIFQALRAHDSSKAGSLMIRHIKNARDSILAREEA